MIIAMFGLYHDLEVGETRYEQISQASWKCWCKFFSWLFAEGIAVPSLFQDGWAVSLGNDLNKGEK